MKYKFDIFDTIYVLLLGIFCNELWLLTTDKTIILYVIICVFLSLIRGFAKGWWIGYDQGFDEGFKFKKEFS